MEYIECAPPYQLVKGRHGLFLINANDAYVGKAIYKYGEYGEVEWHTLAQLMEPNKDAIEVGANIGSHSVSMARTLAQSRRKLLAIEPQPIIFQNLCANIALNGIFNVIAENAACSNQTGWLTFSEPDYQQGNNFGGVMMRDDGFGNQRVRALTLDELVPKEFNVGLIKIDVEGFEQKVLEGATRIIETFRPYIYLENDRLEKSKELIEWLWAADYNLWWDTPRLYNPNNYAGFTENIYGNTASINMVALPESSTMKVTNMMPVRDSDSHPLKR